MLALVAAACVASLTPAQADRFHRRLVNACIRAHTQSEPLRPEQLQVAIIGAGATGVELAAELHKATRTLAEWDSANGSQLPVYLGVNLSAIIP